jgi:hypothetical protein
MYYHISMHINFEAEKNRKALIYTLAICGALLLLFFLIKWPLNKIAPPPPIQDLIEVNLGNEFEGMGDEQPLIKGERAPATEPMPQPQSSAAAANDEPAKDIETDDNANEEAAAVTKVEKNNSKKFDAPKENVTKPVKTNNPVPVPTPAPPKPQKPKYAYNGPGNGKGNGADQDNGYTNQGNNPNGKGDAGNPDGKPDSYGNNPGGRIGGPKVIGNRKIVKYYSFTGDLEKATINAIVKVSPAGIGTFAGFGKGSTKTSQQYANAIRDYLRNIQFDKAAEESTVTVQFNFNVQ